MRHSGRGLSFFPLPSIISFVATRTVTVMIDDIDGVEIENGEGETVHISLDGISYSIDLSKQNAKKLRETLSVYIENGRRMSRKTTSQGRSRQSDNTDLAAAREWLRANGEPVSDRGRIAAPLMEKFRSATK